MHWIRSTSRMDRDPSTYETREGSENTSFVKLFKKVVPFGVRPPADCRAWPGWGPPEGGQIVGKRRQCVGNEEIGFANDAKQNAHEQIAFADEQKRNPCEQIAFPHEQK